MKKPIERPFVESYAEKAGLLKVKRDKHARLVYLSGAVTNDPHAKLKFDLAELYLKSKGNRVINPLRVNPIGTPWEDALITDLGIINQLKDAYIALLRLSRFSSDEIFLPVIADIDLPNRQFDSPGKRLEKGMTYDVLPILQMPSDWDKLLMDAIKEKEAHDAEKS